MFDWLTDLFLGDGGEKKNQMQKNIDRESFSQYLPYVAYDAEKNEYHNSDNSMGYIWECVPLTFLGDKECQSLEGLFRMEFAPGTVMQFMLYPDPDIQDFIDRYQSTKTRSGELMQKSMHAFSKFIQDGTSGLEAMSGIPVRNFRLFISLKSSESVSDDNIAIIEDTLTSIGLCPKKFNANGLVKLLRGLFNVHQPESIDQYNDEIPLRKQIIFSETPVKSQDNQIQIGNRWAKCLTPKTLPKDAKLIDTNTLSGGFQGPKDDASQINAPFVWTMSVLFDDVSTEIHQKSSLTMMQKASGSFAIQVQKRVEEFTWALSELDNERFLRVIPQLWIFGKDEKSTSATAARAQRIWESKNYIMQEETHIAEALLIAGLPFGLYATSNNIKTLDRDFILPCSTLVRLLPIQGDYVGNQESPVLPYIGRKGQVVGLDVFDERSNNHNFLVTAGSGSGKTFFLNHLCSNYYAANSMVRIVDIGYGYQKLSNVTGGRFMDFGRHPICINPFHSNATNEEDRQHDLIATTNVVAEMLYSASRADLHETEWTLLKEAVRWAAKRDGGVQGINHVCEYLSTFPEHADKDMQRLSTAANTAAEMAFNLRDFKQDGIYGHFFNGHSNFDIQSDDFVVLELEVLKPQPELFRVVTMQVLNAVTQDLYLSDRSSRRFILFEEAWSFFDSGNRIGSVINEGYRRARRYQGSFGIVTQSILDTIKFGDAGDVIRSNSDYKFFLESGDYPAANKAGIIDYDQFSLDLLSGIKSMKPRYSEVFLDTPLGKGPARLIVDPWTYWVNTSAGSEVSKFNALYEKTGDVVQTIEMLTGKRPMPKRMAA